MYSEIPSVCLEAHVYFTVFLFLPIGKNNLAHFTGPFQLEIFYDDSVVSPCCSLKMNELPFAVTCLTCWGESMQREPSPSGWGGCWVQERDAGCGRDAHCGPPDSPQPAERHGADQQLKGWGEGRERLPKLSLAGGLVNGSQGVQRARAGGAAAAASHPLGCRGLGRPTGTARACLLAGKPETCF